MRHIEAGRNLALGDRTLLRTQAANLEGMRSYRHLSRRPNFKICTVGFGGCFGSGMPGALSQGLSWAPGTEG